MKKCYEYLKCSQKDCVMYEREDSINCWEVEGTLCNHTYFELIKKAQKDKCSYCIYYKAVVKDNIYKKK